MKLLLNNLFSPDNEFFLLAKDEKKLTHIALSSFILPILFIVLAGLLTHFVLSPLILGNTADYPYWIHQVFGLYFMFGSAIIILFLWVRFYEGRKISTLGFTKQGALYRYLNGFLLGIVINSIVIGITALMGSIEVAENSANVTGTAAIGIVVVFLFGFVVQGASEEILTRGWMLQVIGARYKPWLGVLISTILFTLLHSGNSGINLTSVINLILVAVMLALMVLNDGSLWSVCAWHSGWNWSLGNFYGLSVSGSGEKVSIFDLNTTGDSLISGGGFGPEGSLVTTGVIIVVIVIYALIIMNKKKI
jgi:membrane protease YdiL (CAAX protease family)